MKRRFTLPELPSVARELFATYSEARVFALHGDLGAGKTTLVQALAHYLGVEAPLTSPTFSIVNSYRAGVWDVHHFDFYRIERPDEAIALGLDDYFAPGAYCFIEWPERVEGLLPPETIHLQLATVDDAPDTRLLTVFA